MWKMTLGNVINPEFYNHQRFGCLSLFRATTSLRRKPAMKSRGNLRKLE